MELDERTEKFIQICNEKALLAIEWPLYLDYMGEPWFDEECVLLGDEGSENSTYLMPVRRILVL
jgi:hypothetical protein